MDYNNFIKYLKDISDYKYKVFSERTIKSKYEMLGIRIPILRKIAKEINNKKEFLNINNSYYEIVMIKGFVIGLIKDLDIFIKYFNSYILLIDNWAICDSFVSSLKIIDKNREYFINIVNELVNSKEEYIVRVGLIILLDYYIKKENLSYIFNILDRIDSDKYYINMALAWVICECFVKYESDTLKYLENNKLNKFVINKAISKIHDSYRVSNNSKEYIKRFKV